MVAGGGHQPVVAVDQVEIKAVAQLDARGQHVGVHVLDPGHELAQVAGAAGLADAVDHDPLQVLLGGHRLVAARQDVDLHVLGDQLLGELADVPGQAALHDRRVLPGQDQRAHPQPSGSPATCSDGARWRRTGSAEPIPRAASSAWAWSRARRRG